MQRRQRERLAFLIVLACVFALAALNAASFPARARIFPQFVSTVGFLLALVEIRRTRNAARRGEPDEGPTLARQLRLGAPYLLWIVAYYVAIAIIGFLPASAVLVFLFLHRVGRLSWRRALLAPVPLIIGLAVLGQSMGVVWPQGAVPAWVAERAAETGR